MLDRNGFEKWVAENGTGHVVRKHFNGIDYAFATMNDGWIAIFEVDDGMYMQIANNYDEFVKKVTDAEMEMLNGDAGQELVQKLLEMKLASNPHLTVEEWNRTKQEFLVFLFAMLLDDKPELRDELGRHLWGELQKEAENGSTDR